MAFGTCVTPKKWQRITFLGSSIGVGNDVASEEKKHESWAKTLAIFVFIYVNW